MMADFRVELKELGACNAQLQTCRQKLNTEAQRIDGIKLSAHMGEGFFELQVELGILKGQLHQESTDLNTLLLYLAKVKTAYEAAENTILGLNASGEELAGAQEGDADSFLENALQQAVLGEFYEGETNWLGDLLSFIVACIPGLNCIADIRDLAADIMKVFDDGKLEFTEILMLGADVIGLAGDVLSLGEIVKALKGYTTATKLADTAAKEYVKESADNVAQKAAKKIEKEAAEKAADEAGKKWKKTVVKETIDNVKENGLDKAEEAVVGSAVDLAGGSQMSPEEKEKTSGAVTDTINIVQGAYDLSKGRKKE